MGRVIIDLYNLISIFQYNSNLTHEHELSLIFVDVNYETRSARGRSTISGVLNNVLFRGKPCIYNTMMKKKKFKRNGHLCTQYDEMEGNTPGKEACIGFNDRMLTVS